MKVTLETPAAKNLDGLWTQCKERYTKKFGNKSSNDNPVFYKEPILTDGKIQLNFANVDDAHEFFRELQEAQDTKQPFIVTQEEKVLGYTTKGGDYQPNYPSKDLGVIRENMEKYEPFEKGQMTENEQLQMKWREQMLKKVAQWAIPLNKKDESADIKEQDQTVKKLTVKPNTTNDEENDFLKKCQELYREKFKGDTNKFWYAEPEVLENGNIQLSFENNEQTEAFLASMAEQNPDLRFIVTEGDKVLGYTSPVGVYTKNPEGMSLKQCQEKMQNLYQTHNTQSNQIQPRPFQTSAEGKCDPFSQSAKAVTGAPSNNSEHNNTEDSTPTLKP